MGSPIPYIRARDGLLPSSGLISISPHDVSPLCVVSMSNTVAANDAAIQILKLRSNIFGFFVTGTATAIAFVSADVIAPGVVLPAGMAIPALGAFGTFSLLAMDVCAHPLDAPSDTNSATTATLCIMKRSFDLLSVTRSLVQGAARRR